jgi:3-oxoacyl-[acyl-carrier-protein] synthase-1/3-oxoacyl-[acyl-carrier-protein] synthase II
MGLITAAGKTRRENVRALETGDSATAAPPPFATSFTSPVFLAKFDTPSFTDPLASPLFLTRTAHLALRAAKEALSQARVDRETAAFSSMGVAAGTSVGASLDFFGFYKDSAGGKAPPLDEIDRYLASNPALALARFFGCRGPAQCVTNACSSGADAIGLAASWIRAGRCSLALAGGADALSPITYAGFSSLRLCSPESCRPFDAGRSGLTLGEGAAFFVLESEVSRAKRGAFALAFVSGHGTATDAHHLTAPHPDGRGLRSAMEQAFVQSGEDWHSVAFINAHGTGTLANDAAEARFFRACCPDTPFIATKGATGHTLGAAGAVEAVLTVEHLLQGLLPASPRFREPDSALGVSPVSRPTTIHGRSAVSQSLAFGGNNSVLVLARGDV